MKKRIGEQKKDKKRVKILIFCIISLVLLLGICLILYVKFDNDLLKNIKKHYDTNVITTKKINIYDKNEKIIGKLSKDFTLTLEKQKFKDTKNKYYRIKNTNYYIYYLDVKPSKIVVDDKINPNYLIFNKNIEVVKNAKFYYKDKEAFSIKKNLSLPIEYMDDNYYYVLYLDHLMKLKITSKDILTDKENTKEEESNYISVINYDTIYSNEACSTINCIPLSKVEEETNYLKEAGYYSISIDEYKAYLNKRIRLKKNAILLTTTNSNDTLTNWNNKSEYKINLIDDNTGLKFNNTNKKSTKDSNIESIDRYSIKSITSLDNFKKMVNGEDVVEEVIFKAKANEQSIPVLNYHFFYDPSQGESCNENICLDVKVFRQHLDYLKNNGYKTLKMDEFTKWMYGEIELPEKSVLITVDDGAMGTGKHNGNKLIPILEEYNMNATLFLISGWWDVNNYRSKNLDVQSHTYDMHQYGDCGRGQVVCASKEQLMEDLKKSLSIVDNNNSFCFPFYSYSASSLETVKEAGFKLAFVGGSRKAKRSDNKYLVPRYPIHKSHSMEQFINMVS